MTRSRWLGACALAMACLLGLATGASAKTKAPKVELADGCSIVSDQQVADAFGEPVSLVLYHAVGTFDCVYDVGNTLVPPGGRFVAFQEYPSYFDDVPSPRFAVEDRRAIDILAGDEAVDVDDLGITAYINYSKGTIVVAASRKFAFSLDWTPGGREGITKAEAKKLIALAKNVVKRSPK